MGWLRLVGSWKSYVSFAKEPYERDDILQKRPIILRGLLIVATSYAQTYFAQHTSLCAQDTSSYFTQHTLCAHCAYLMKCAYFIVRTTCLHCTWHNILHCAYCIKCTYFIITTYCIVHTWWSVHTSLCAQRAFIVLDTTYFIVPTASSVHTSLCAQRAFIVPLQCMSTWVSFAKEPYKRDYILQKRPIILRGTNILHTTGHNILHCAYCIKCAYFIVHIHRKSSPYLPCRFSQLSIEIPGATRWNTISTRWGWNFIGSPQGFQY